MSELFLIAKAMFLTIVVVIVLQVKVGDYTLEEKAKIYALNSPMAGPLMEVAQGGAKVVTQGWSRLLGLMGNNISDFFNSDSTPGKRSLDVGLERSTRYLKETAKKAEQEARETWDEYKDSDKQSEALEKVIQE